MLSVQWAPLRTDGPHWTDNILVTSPSWGTIGTATNLNWGSQLGGNYGSIAVPWSGPIHSMPDYVRRSPENTRSAARHVCDDLLQENCMARVQSLFTSRRILRDRLVNWQDCDWDDLWDEPVDQ